jgi:hypothetical protein
MRSLQRALHKDEAGRRITDPVAGPLFSDEYTDDDQAAGTIYVLRAFAGWDLHPLESAALSRRTPFADIGWCSFDQSPDLHRHRDQVGEVASAHAFHHPSAMILHSSRADIEFDPDLFA